MTTLLQLGELVHPVDRADPTRKGEKFIKYIDIASIDRETKAVVSVSNIEALSAPSRARQRLLANDVLVSTVRPNLNATAILPSHLTGSIGSTGLCVLRADAHRLLPSYLFYFTQSHAFVSRLSTIANGASYPAVTDDDVLETSIALPSIADQAIVVNILNRADRLRRMRRHALQMCRDLQLNSFRERFKSGHTNPTRLGEICSRITDGAHLTPTYTIGGIPFLRVTDIQDEEIDWTRVKRISPDEYEGITRRVKAHVGDILYSKNGTIGIAREITWREPFAHFVSLALLKPKRERVHPTFLTDWLNTPEALEQATRRSKTGTVTNLHLNEIEKMIVPLPSLAEQEEMVKLTSATKKLRSTCVEALHQADHLFQTLLHQVFETEPVAHSAAA